MFSSILLTVIKLNTFCSPVKEQIVRQQMADTEARQFLKVLLTAFVHLKSLIDLIAEILIILNK